MAGKQKGMSKGDNTRSGLLWEVERLLNETKELPQYLLMENVPEVIGQKNIKDFALWVAFLESKGYKNYYQILNAKDYGIPQNRERCFMVSFLDKRLFTFPKPIKLKARLKDLLENVVGEAYYPRKELIENLKNVIYENENYMQFVWEGHLEMDCRVWKTVSPTLCTKCKYVLIYDKENNIRHITQAEAFRLMGFNDEDFYKASQVNSPPQLYRQAGNSIVVNVLMTIFNKMFIDISLENYQTSIFDFIEKE